MAPKSPNEALIEDDVAVTREIICELFDPPPGKTAFFDWVNKGHVVKARSVKGYYLLNATRVRQGMNPVDARAYRKRTQETPSELLHWQLLYLAAVNLDHQHQILCPPPNFELPESLTTQQLNTVEQMQKDLLVYTKHFDQSSEWHCWMLGVLASLAVLDQSNC